MKLETVNREGRPRVQSGADLGGDQRSPATSQREEANLFADYQQ
jgi:hypothetical protein